MSVFVWDDKPVENVRDLFDTALAAARDGRADEYLATYRAAEAHADANLGYVIGYGSDETRRLMYQAFRLHHPIFGGQS